MNSRFFQSCFARLAPLIVTLLAAPVSATVIFDNFAPVDVYNTGNGALVIDNSPVGFPGTLQIGASFVVPSTAYPWQLDSVDLPLSLDNGSNTSFNIQVQGNTVHPIQNLDIPDSTPVGLGLVSGATATPAIHTANYSGVTLQPGQKYWVVVDGNFNRGVWHYNVLGQNGRAENLSSFGWSYDTRPNNDTPAFRVNATINPPECYLANHDFERTESTGGGLPTGFLDWKGDISHVTTFTHGILPHSGQLMLQFDGTAPSGGSPTSVASEVWQLVDVSHLANEIAAGNVFADFEYYANRVTEEPDALPMVDTLFTARLQANSGPAASFPSNVNNYLGLSTSQLISDNDADTWQNLSTSMQVPAGTTYLAVRVAAHENILNDTTGEFAGHFADSACVRLRVVPEPASGALAVVVCGVVFVLRERRIIHSIE